jgi:hypothetical protein
VSKTDKRLLPITVTAVTPSEREKQAFLPFARSFCPKDKSNPTEGQGENIKNISIHNLKHLKPANDNEFGHYLAGLIDGDGHFSSAQQLVIVFNSLDIQLAYYIRERIGHGTVRKVKNKNAVLMIVASKKGIETVINLINNKFRTTSKFDQIIKNILTNPNYLEFSKTINLSLNTSNNLENH